VIYQGVLVLFIIILGRKKLWPHRHILPYYAVSNGRRSCKECIRKTIF